MQGHIAGIVVDRLMQIYAHTGQEITLSVAWVQTIPELLQWGDEGLEPTHVEEDAGFGSWEVKGWKEIGEVKKPLGFA